MYLMRGAFYIAIAYDIPLNPIFFIGITPLNNTHTTKP